MLKDYLNKTISVGDKLVYPIRRGSDMYLRTLVVNALNHGIVYGINDKGRSVKLTQTSRCIVVEKE